MRIPRWPDNSSWPLTICLSLSLGIVHASGVKHWCAILVVYHHGHRRWGGNCSGYLTPWGVWVLHGLGTGFPEVVVKKDVIDPFLIIGWSTLSHCLQKVREIDLELCLRSTASCLHVAGSTWPQALQVLRRVHFCAKGRLGGVFLIPVS